MDSCKPDTVAMDLKCHKEKEGMSPFVHYAEDIQLCLGAGTRVESCLLVLLSCRVGCCR